MHVGARGKEAAGLVRLGREESRHNLVCLRLLSHDLLRRVGTQRVSHWQQVRGRRGGGVLLGSKRRLAEIAVKGSASAHLLLLLWRLLLTGCSGNDYCLLILFAFGGVDGSSSCTLRGRGEWSALADHYTPWCAIENAVFAFCPCEPLCFRAVTPAI